MTNTITLENTRLTFNVEMYNLGTGKHDEFILGDWDDYETFMQGFNPYDNDCEVFGVQVDEIGTHVYYFEYSIKQLIEIIELVGTVGNFEKFDMLLATADCFEDAIDAYKFETFWTFNGCRNKVDLAVTHAEEYGVFNDLPHDHVLRNCFDFEQYYNEYIDGCYTVGKFPTGTQHAFKGIHETTYTYILIDNN